MFQTRKMLLDIMESVNSLRVDVGVIQKDIEALKNDGIFSITEYTDSQSEKLDALSEAVGAIQNDIRELGNASGMDGAMREGIDNILSYAGRPVKKGVDG